MDPLADVLDVSRVSGTVLAHVRAHAPWGLDLAPAAGAACHAVTAGIVWLEIEGRPSLQLMTGDVVVLPTGTRHALVSEPGVPARAYDTVAKEQLMTDDGDLEIPGPGAGVRFICAAFSYDHEVAHPLLSLLPEVVHVSADEIGDGSAVQTTLRLLAGELGKRHMGARAAVDRLIDVLFIHVVRAWALSVGDADAASWLRGLRDPVVASSLALLHDRPEVPWTLEELAAEVHVSRATLARRFTELVGEPPMSYLTRWRMDVAARLLRDSEVSVEAVAHRVGYSSEYAFSRAFSRHRGRPPGGYRRSFRAAAGSRSE